MNKIDYPEEFIEWWKTTQFYKESKKSNAMVPVMWEAFKEVAYNSWVAGRLYEKDEMGKH